MVGATLAQLAVIHLPVVSWQFRTEPSALE
jgi:hypothetical protein